MTIVIEVIVYEILQKMLQISFWVGDFKNINQSNRLVSDSDDTDIEDNLEND